ncbi:hypothetical protein BV394_05285 [Brevirhabdus pacifica]|uniref:Flagellar motor switch protein FliN n=2 Tax=Brevirhabdus pacifica TaxID=1267768 RepID=A0A1U7DGS2_9RHOB|nr:FliM/FliN family flagellar motor switch protein [Brevirhabdus pacifica]APX89200.1 hypothetical protein BV394_05285 [Brevirhabdus pacifica]OWU76751.1 hypothetical protein ATO5_11000 [Loktanella sp. 22II-4b]PJJ86198.1 flagellar motor switch protein FliN/FliY [Brevirhabdus pacifica]
MADERDETGKTAAPAGAASDATMASGAASGMEEGLGLKPAPEDPPSVIQTMAGEVQGRNIDAMLNVGLDVQIILGRSRMPISKLLKLSRGSVIELDKKIGEPVEVVINDRLVARGDLVKLAGDRIGVTLTAIAKDYVGEV